MSPQFKGRRGLRGALPCSPFYVIQKKNGGMRFSLKFNTVGAPMFNFFFYPDRYKAI